MHHKENISPGTRGRSSAQHPATNGSLTATKSKPARNRFDPARLAYNCPLERQRRNLAAVKAMLRRGSKARDGQAPLIPPHPSDFPETSDDVLVRRPTTSSLRVRARSVSLEPTLPEFAGAEDQPTLQEPVTDVSASASSSGSSTLKRPFLDTTNIAKDSRSSTPAPSSQTASAEPAKSSRSAHSPVSEGPPAGESSTSEVYHPGSAESRSLATADKLTPINASSTTTESFEGDCYDDSLERVTNHIVSLFTSHKRFEWTRAELWASFRQQWQGFSRRLFNDALRNQMFAKRLGAAKDDPPVYSLSA